MIGVTGGVGGVLEPRLGMSVLASNETQGRYEHFQAELEGTLTSDGVSRLFVRIATQTDRDNLSDQPEGTLSDRETPEPHLHMAWRRGAYRTRPRKRGYMISSFSNLTKTRRKPSKRRNNPSIVVHRYR